MYCASQFVVVIALNRVSLLKGYFEGLYLFHGSVVLDGRKFTINNLEVQFEEIN